MGLYDIVVGQQIKSTPEPSMRNYEIGDAIKLPDGVHITLDGAFVVDNEKVLYATEHIFDKWGNTLTASKLLDYTHPLKAALKELNENNRH